jgi:hypothetical protein
MNMQGIVSEVQYFGCVAQFAELFAFQNIYLEKHENFQKMSFRNRCQILGANKIINLSVPILGGRDQKAYTKNIEIDNNQKWAIQHWRTLESCYNKSAYFIYYGPEVKEIIFGNYQELWQLNEASLKWALKKLGWKGNIHYTADYEKTLGPSYVDIRNKYTPANKNLTPLPTYYQVFDVPFESNLSILDLIFNLGPQSASYLQSVHKIIQPNF